NSGSGGGSLEATPSWSQLSSSPTISQQHITATAKSKEGLLSAVDIFRSNGRAAQLGPQETGAAGGQVYRRRQREYGRQHWECQWRC
ncbi:hypothetical protein XENOCAPTIV_023941, partial [Xenoophorus captivus]